MNKTNESILKLEKKNADIFHKLNDCKDKNKKCTFEIRSLKNNLHKSGKSKALERWLSRKEKINTNMRKLKDTLRKNKRKLIELRKKLFSKTTYKSGGAPTQSPFDPISPYANLDIAEQEGCFAKSRARK